jgi:hypothetical protein
MDNLPEAANLPLTATVADFAAVLPASVFQPRGRRSQRATSTRLPSASGGWSLSTAIEVSLPASWQLAMRMHGATNACRLPSASPERAVGWGDR